MSSIFTKIIRRELPAEIIHETDNVIALLDIHPIRPGHILVVPKTEVDSLWDLDRDTYREVMDIAREMALLLKSKLNPPRVGLVVEGFDVAHAHLHVTPLEAGSDIVATTRSLDAEPEFEALRQMHQRLEA